MALTSSVTMEIFLRFSDTLGKDLFLIKAHLKAIYFPQYCEESKHHYILIKILKPTELIG